MYICISLTITKTTIMGIQSFKSAKVTRGTYLKTLSIAQGIISKQTANFIETGIMVNLTLEERQMMSFSAMLKESCQMPKCLKASNCSSLIEKVIKFVK